MRNYSSKEIYRMTKALDASDDTLFAAIGHHVVRSELKHLGITDGEEPPEDEKRRRGHSWLAQNIDRVREVVCNNEDVKSASKKVGKDDKVNLGLAICDAITCLVIGVPPFFISALIVKIGLQNFCSRAEVPK